MTVSTRLWTTEATGGMGRGGVGRAGGAVIDRIISATAIIPTSRHPECRRKRFVQCERNNTKRTLIVSTYHSLSTHEDSVNVGGTMHAHAKCPDWLSSLKKCIVGVVSRKIVIMDQRNLKVDAENLIMLIDDKCRQYYVHAFIAMIMPIQAFPRNKGYTWGLHVVSKTSE